MSNKVLKINNWIRGGECNPFNGCWLEKYNPHSGEILNYYADSNKEDVNSAIESAADAFKLWSDFTPVRRGQVLSDIVAIMKLERSALAECIAVETGKPMKDAIETIGSIVVNVKKITVKIMAELNKCINGIITL